MASEAKLSHTAALILHAISSGHGYGFSVMEVTGLEKQSIADKEQRPPRKYYTTTRDGRSSLVSLHKRYPLLARLIPVDEVEHV
jgi:PadR family transcriptional regulator PadR